MVAGAFKGTDPGSSVTSKAHLVTYLVRDDQVLYRVATNVEWDFKDGKLDKGPVYVVSGKAAGKLDPAHHDALVRDFPAMDFLP
jgi:hypothetical protein